MSSVSNGLYFLTLPLVSVMRVIYRKIRHARYLYIKLNVEKVWGARYPSKNTVYGTALLEKLMVPQSVKKFIYRARKFITAFTGGRHLSLFLSRSVKSTAPSYFSNIHFNIILPYTSGSSKWSLSLAFSHQSPICTSPNPHTCHMPLRYHFS